MIRELKKHAVKTCGRLGIFDRFHFLIIGSAKCGTTSLHSYLRSHPDVYMPSLDTGVNGETGNFLEHSTESIKGLSNIDIKASAADILATYDGEVLIGERSTDYTKRPYRSVRIEDIHPGTKIIFLYRNPIERIRKMYNHHLKHRPEKTSQYFRDEDVGYYVRTSMYWYQTKPWVNVFDSFCAANIHVDDSHLFSEITDFLEIPTLGNTLSERRNVNRSKKLDIELTGDERERLRRDFRQFQDLLESSEATHIKG
nr:sulfotransferase domain-containing protein [Salinibacter ruber]